MKRTIAAIIGCLIPTVASANLSMAPRKSELEKALSVIMATALPQMPDAARQQRIDSYEDVSRPNKGQAVELIAGQTWKSQDHEDPTVTGERVLEGCELRYAKPCALIAVNDEIVAEGGLSPRDMPRLHYAGKFDPARIPIARLADRNRADVQNYAMAKEPKAMAIHPWGQVFTSQGNASLGDAQEAVLAKCNGDPFRRGRDGGCFLYAINNDVVISKRLMAAQ